MKFRRWLFGQTLTARCARSFLLTLIPLVSANGAFSLDLDAWKIAALAAISAGLTPFVAALAVADE